MSSFFVGAQTVVSLLQTTQIISLIRRLFYVAMLLMSPQIKPENHLNQDGTLFLPGVDAPHVYVRAWAQVASAVILVPEPF